MSGKKSKKKVHTPTTSIVLNVDDFALDAQEKLGRANGNTYQRKPGVENVHDGQIMVRLKRHRFIILDYGYIPNEQDRHIAKSVPHIHIPDGAGTTKCLTKNCPRVGVPVMLYDSDPAEPSSLYLRGGLCFSCQRNLNEKRRTKKRRPDEGEDDSKPPPTRFRVNGELIDLNPDAIIINGPIEGTRARSSNYQHPQIGADVLQIVGDLSQEADNLFSHMGNGAGMAQAVANTATINALYEKTFLSLSKATFLITQWKASWDEALANSAAAHAAVNTTPMDTQALDEAVAATAAALATASHEGGDVDSDELPDAEDDLVAV